MKLTLARHWRRTLNAINPPLQRTARESQKLLNVLNRSFRRELEVFYPSTKSHHVNRHLRSILDNPLFSHNKIAIYDVPKIMQSIVDKDALTLPVVQLRSAIARGHAEQETVHHILNSHAGRCKDISSYTNTYRKEAASLLIQWLESNGLDHSLRFLPNHGLRNAIIQTLVINGDYSRVLSWFREHNSKLRQVNQEGKNQTPTFLRSRIFSDLVKAEVHLGGGIESALSIFHAYVAKARNESILANESKCIFVSAGNYLMKCIRKEVQRDRLDVKYYDRLTRSVHEWSNSPDLKHAWLSVGHPRYPDPQPALDYLHHFANNASWMTASKRKAVAHLAVDASSLLLSQHREPEARQVMQILEQFFDDIIGTDKKPLPSLSERKEDREPASEWANVQLLNEIVAA